VPSADVVVVGAGLSGLTAAIGLAEAGARVEVIARGHAATHWTAGGFDVAAPADSGTAADGMAALAIREGHPYALLAAALPDGLGRLREVLAEDGLDYVGELGDPLRPVPTAIGATRRAAILPAGQATALAPWRDGERLVVCGPRGFKDFWPTAVAASLSRSAVWGRDDDVASRPDRVDGLSVELPGLAGRLNLNALDLARFFDEPSWRREAFARIAAAVEPIARRGPVRIGFPAVLGQADHAGVLDDAATLLPGPIFEIPLVPPSVPGLRLFRALRSALRRRGGGLVIGEPVVRIDTDGRSVVRVAASAAVRERTIRTGALVLATGGIAAGGLVGRADGRLEEPLLGLPVEAPAVDDWLAPDPFDPAGHPLETAGIRTDGELRPVDARSRIAFRNVAVVGAMLAGQRSLSERCGDGVAIASGARAAAVLAPAGASGAPARVGQPARRTA
jgi:glycerol-3-phosphate dehydrogenase subunit B